MMVDIRCPFSVDDIYISLSFMPSSAPSSRNSSLPNNELAREIRLSLLFLLKMFKLLEDIHMSDSFIALVNPVMINNGQTFFNLIWLQTQDENTTEHFAHEISHLSQVLERYLMLDDCDAIVRIIAVDIDAYYHF